MRNLPISNQGNQFGNHMQRSPNHEHHRRPERKTDSPANLNTYLNILRRRKGIIIVPLFIVLPLVAASLVLKQPSYQSTATLLIETYNPRVIKIEEVKSPDKSYEYYKSQYALIKSQTVVGQVVDILKSQQNHQTRVETETDSLAYKLKEFKSLVQSKIQEIREKVIGSSPTEMLQPEDMARRAQIARLQRAIYVSPNGVRLVNVTITGSEPSRITRQVNTLLDVYIAQNLETKVDASEQASTWLIEKVNQLKQELQQAEMALQDFIVKHKIIPAEVGERAHVAVEEFKTLSASYADLKAERVDLEAQLSELRQLRRQPFTKLSILSTKIESPLIDALRARHTDLQLQRTEFLENFKEKHPRVTAIDNRIRNVEQSIKKERNEYSGLINSRYRIISEKIKLF